jgi:MFS family permease
VGVIALTGFSQTAETFPVWGVLLKPITQEFQWSRSAFTGAMTIGTVGGALVALAFGPMLDRFGPRWSMSGALFVMGATLVLMAPMSALWHFYVLLVVGRVMHIGIVGLATSVVIPKWFVAKRGRAAAISRLGNRVGSTVTPVYAQVLVSFGSWRAAVAVVGIVVWIVSMVPAALFLRRRPEDIGLLPDGDSPAADSESTEAALGHHPRPRREENSLSVRAVLHSRSFYLLTAAHSLIMLTGPATSLHLMPHLTDLGLSPKLAVTVIALSSASGGVGSLLFGLLAERSGSRHVAAFTLVVMAGAYAALLAIDTGTLALVWGVCYGLAHGGTMLVVQIIFPDYFGRDSLGAIRGIIAPVQGVMHALGPIGAAIAYDLTESYMLVFVVFAVATLLAAVCILLARPPQVSERRPSLQEGGPQSISGLRSR